MWGQTVVQMNTATREGEVKSPFKRLALNDRNQTAANQRAIRLAGALLLVNSGR